MRHGRGLHISVTASGVVKSASTSATGVGDDSSWFVICRDGELEGRGERGKESAFLRFVGVEGG